MSLLRASFKTLARAAARALSRTRAGRYFLDHAFANLLERRQIVRHNGTRLEFVVPNRLATIRCDTFSTKEPETLSWIDAIPRGAVLWDVGANVGLYTCYAGVARQCRVFAFEPSVFNLELLARNIAANGLTKLATVVPLALSDARGMNTLNMTTTDWAGALSTFGHRYGNDGKPIIPVFEYPTLGVSLDDAVSLLGLPPPGYLKMDVDGIEHLILSGGARTLAGVREVLVEVNDAFEEQAAQTSRNLGEAGLRFVEKRHASQYEGTAHATSYNQLWRRS